MIREIRSIVYLAIETRNNPDTCTIDALGLQGYYILYILSLIIDTNLECYII